MPLVHKPSDAAKKFPREFAILQQLKPDASGNVKDEILKEYQKLCGDEKAVVKPELTFEEFAALFVRPKTTVEGSGNTIGWAAQDKSSELAPYRFDRRPVGETDVRIQITHASICHSDIHQVKDEWKNAKYPMVPGHEIVGIVTEVGSKVTAIKVGERAGVGCMINSCQQCPMCASCDEQFCPKCAFTYNSAEQDGTPTQGGYSTNIVVAERFALRVPDNLPLEACPPLLCAGITVYSPMRKQGLDKAGMHIGVVGLGGLGAHAVAFAKAFGCHVTVISTSPAKRDEALHVLKADKFVVSRNPEDMKAASSSLDGIVNTVSANHELKPLLDLLKVDGKMVVVGVPPEPPVLPWFDMVFKRLSIVGSLIGGTRETQEMLDFCGQHNLTLPYEKIAIDYVNTAYERVVKSDVRYRFVIDIQSSLVQ